ncbi:carboxymuconolactone decarboxylase family protein [Poriferisphaera sp. WC338]|uniref:carboxymuconolactone decarboxylase family protein n=1 Tax=Poriferisphaera sp. WC338 TaxID=3425129 RepID=UPI003D818FE7
MPTIMTGRLDALKDRLPEEAKDLKLNLGGIFNSEVLSPEQVWGVVLTSALFLKDKELAEAASVDAEASEVSVGMISDAKAAASLMGMNTIYYRFRHLIEKPSYGQKPARLRMQRMMRPATSKVDFELLSTAAAVLSGCQMCIQSHEASVLKEGLTEEHVHEVARIAAVIHGVSIALQIDI